MKKKLVNKTRKSASRSRASSRRAARSSQSSQLFTPQAFCVSPLWAEVHPKPPFPIDHPIPRLQASPVPPPVERRGKWGEGRGKPQPAAVEYLRSLLCVSFMLAVLASGCTGARPLRGGKAVLRKRAGDVEQMLVQGENASQPTRQHQQSIRVRTYTVPAGSRFETAQAPGGEGSLLGRPASDPAAPSTISDAPFPAFVVSAPMPVVEREETRALTEMGAAQKDTAREVGARLSSLKSIVWVGAAVFVFGLASLVWPPLRALIGSVTTSAALMLGGLALVVLPSVLVGNELLVMGAVALAVGAWFVAHRHGRLRGKVESGK